MHTRIPGAVGTLFALDMAVKQYIEENVSEKEEKNFCGTKVLIRKVYNKGFAFNSMDSEPDKVKKASVITTAVKVKSGKTVQIPARSIITLQSY